MKTVKTINTAKFNSSQQVRILWT